MYLYVNTHEYTDKDDFRIVYVYVFVPVIPIVGILLHFKIWPMLINNNKIGCGEPYFGSSLSLSLYVFVYAI